MATLAPIAFPVVIPICAWIACLAFAAVADKKRLRRFSDINPDRICDILGACDISSTRYAIRALRNDLYHIALNEEKYIAIKK